MKIWERFNPRAPCGARQIAVQVPLYAQRHFNPRAPCGARPITRAPPEPNKPFQPTRPLRGATIESEREDLIVIAFQPTRPLRGATAAHRHGFVVVDISTHAPLAGRDSKSTRPARPPCNFNPRAPCGARLKPTPAKVPYLSFQPTRPLRGATGNFARYCGRTHISTHAPLAGRD